MTAQDATLEYIEFLRQRGSISHIVRAGPGGTLSTLALTQRCLASGVAFPVPLPDGSVGINVASEVPAALAALEVEIEAVTGDMGASSSAEEGEAVDPPADAVVEDLPPPDIVDPIEVVTDATDGGMSQCSSEEGVQASDPLDDATDEGDHVFADAVMRSPGDIPVPGEPEEAADPAAPGNTGVDMCGDIEGVADTPGEDLPAPDGERDATPDDTAPEWVQSQLDMLSDFAVRMDTFATDQAELATKIDGMMARLDEIVARPVPRPDATEFNRGMARMTAAVAQAIRRLESALDPSMAQPGDPAVSDALASGLSSIADAVRASQSTPGSATVAAQPDIAVMASMQETISHQLAKLIEVHQAAKPPAMEEFLQDLRHATAELLAEQARLSRAG